MCTEVLMLDAAEVKLNVLVNFLRYFCSSRMINKYCDIMFEMHHPKMAVWSVGLGRQRRIDCSPKSINHPIFSGHLQVCISALHEFWMLEAPSCGHTQSYLSLLTEVRVVFFSFKDIFFGDKCRNLGSSGGFRYSTGDYQPTGRP